MPLITYSLAHVALKSEGLHRIVDLLRPSAIEYAHATLANIPADASWGSSSRQKAEATIADNGLSGITGGVHRLSIGNQTTTGRVNVLYGLEEPWTDEVDYADSFSATLRNPQVALELEVSQGFVTLKGTEGYALPIIEDGEFRAVLESIVSVINDYPMSLEELGHRPFRVFIGHGGDDKWKTIKLLLENAGFETEAFESETRAGYPTLETVDLMIRGSSVGIGIMTGDKSVAGPLRAKENVVHEIGYCMGALGIKNTIVLLEDGVSEFSNIRGLTQIRFPEGDIGQAIGELTAALTLRKNAAEARH